MLQYPIRLAKRFAVLLPGLIVAYFSVRTVLPFVEHKIGINDALSIVITYALAAYILVPALIRGWRILRPINHVPVYCITPDGFASDPLNIGVIATRRQLIEAMEKAGWYVADPHTPRNIFRHIVSFVFGGEYANAPVSNLYLFGRKQDIAFEIPAGGSTANRHHVRFWATTFDAKSKVNIRTIHWHQRKAHVFGDNLLWVGAASLDVGINFIRHNLQITHMIDPDTNQERDLIVEQLLAQKLISKTETIKLRKPYRLVNRVWTGSLHTDGKMSIIWLKKA